MRSLAWSFNLIASVLLTTLSVSAWGEMPKLKATRTFRVKGDEAFEANRGFGARFPEVDAMNRMMVEGWAPLPEVTRGETHLEVILRPNPPRVGENVIELVYKDPKTGEPVQGLKITAELSMAEMNMGTDTLKVVEFSPARYRLNVEFTMRGKWLLTLSAPGRFQVTYQMDAGGLKAWVAPLPAGH